MKEISVVLVGLYRFQNFPVRILHGILEDIEGVKTHTIFFKDRGTVMTNKATIGEEKLFGELIGELKPDLVGISILSPYVSAARKVTRLIRENSSALVIWGGLHPTIYPESCLKEADMLCVGEGEGAVGDLARHLRDRTPYQPIANLWIKKGNETIKNPMRPLVQDLDSLPFASRKTDSYYFIESNKVTKTDPVPLDSRFFIQSSRGCPFSCSYCINGILRTLYKNLGPYTRKRSVDNVLSEIKENNRAGYITFNDEVFGAEEAWLDEFERRYKKEIGLPFCIECNPRTLNRKMLVKLANAGVDEINFGIQTGSDHIRNNIFNRPGKNAEIVDIAGEITNRGIKISCDFILDNPYDTEESMQEAIRVLLQLHRPSIFFLHSLQYFPNYPLTKKAVEDNHIRPEEADNDNFTARTIRNWGFSPRLFPYTKKQILQNIMWLIAFNHVKDRIAKYAVFNSTPGARICLHLLNIKSIILGRISAAVEYITWKNAAAAYIMNGVKYISKGDFKAIYRKLRKHAGFNAARCR